MMTKAKAKWEPSKDVNSESDVQEWENSYKINIDQVLDRGNKIECLVEKAENLSRGAFFFRKRNMNRYSNDDDFSHLSYSDLTEGGTYYFWHNVTLKDGERILVTDLEGVSRTVDGPRQYEIFRSFVKYLTFTSASATQYLSIEYKDGTKENIKGPTGIWHDPRRYHTISAHSCITLNTNEAMVVYERVSPTSSSPTSTLKLSSADVIEIDNEEDELHASNLYPPSTSANSNIQRKVYWGPSLYVPTPQEWIHKFNWDSRGFYKVNTTPSTLEVQVDWVRTADDGTLDVSLMIYFQVINLEQLLNSTLDPITDFTNAIQSDVILSFSRTSFQEFKLKTEIFNDLRTYPETVTLANRIGYKIHRVVFKGYKAGKALQTVQDGAIKLRTQLMLKEEKETQEHNLDDLKLGQEILRNAKRIELENNKTRAKVEVERLRLQHELEETRLKNKAEMDYLLKLKDLGVDLTSFVVAQQGC